MGNLHHLKVKQNYQICVSFPLRYIGGLNVVTNMTNIYRTSHMSKKQKGTSTENATYIERVEWW